MDQPLLLLFVQVTIFVNMFTIGLNHSWRETTLLWRDLGQLARSLLAVIGLVPAVAMAVLLIFNLPVGVASGMAILAATPGAPMSYHRAEAAAASAGYVASLQLTLALVAVVVTPLTLALFYALFELSTERVPAMSVARQVAIVQFLPVSLALLAGRALPALAAKARPPLNRVGGIMFLLLVLIAIVPGIRLITSVSGLGIIAILLLAVGAFAVGHLVGGPSSGERSGLAVASVARNVGLALYIAALSDAQQEIVPTIVTFMILGGIVAIPYSRIAKKQTT